MGFQLGDLFDAQQIARVLCDDVRRRRVRAVAAQRRGGDPVAETGAGAGAGVDDVRCVDGVVRGTNGAIRTRRRYGVRFCVGLGSISLVGMVGALALGHRFGDAKADLADDGGRGGCWAEAEPPVPGFPATVFEQSPLPPEPPPPAAAP